MNRLTAIILRVDDLEVSELFYRDALGIDLQRSQHDDGDPWIGGVHAAHSWSDGAFMHFALYPAGDARPSTNTQIAFAVESLDVAHRRAVDAGAPVIHDQRDEPWGRSARYQDPDGNVVELTQPM